MTGENFLGYGYLTLVGAALAYTLWFRGIAALPVGSITFLSLLSPVVAVISGWVVLDQVLSGWQVAGVAVVLSAVLVVTLHPTPPRRVHGGSPPRGSDLRHRQERAGRGHRLPMTTRPASA